MMWALIKFIPPKLIVAITIAGIAVAMTGVIRVQHKKLQTLTSENQVLHQDYLTLVQKLNALEKLKTDMQIKLKTVKNQASADEKNYEKINQNNQDWSHQPLPNGIDRLLN